jgi:aspartyl-tRNA(Asn)/glutamyl-tRNA(Gln) amidotransferase subunit B
MKPPRRQARRQLGDQRTVRPLNKEGRDITGSPVSAAQLAAIVDLIGEGTISGKIAKDLFEIVWQEGGDPRALVEARGMKQVTDLGAIEKVVDDIIAANPDKVAQAQAKPQLIGWFVGQVMKSSGGKANPQARTVADQPLRRAHHDIIAHSHRPRG